MGREGARLRDFQAGGDFFVHPHRQPQRVPTRARVRQGAVALRGHALHQFGVMLQRFLARVCGGLGVGRHQLAVLHPGAWADMGLAVVGEQLQRPHLLDTAELLQGREHRHFQPQVVAVASHLDQVLQYGLHRRGSACGSGRGQRRLKTMSHTPWPNRKPRFSNLVRGR